jgi:hypothetical protein
LCDRALLLNHGVLIGQGAPDDVISKYAHLGAERNRIEQERAGDPAKAAHIVALTFLDERGSPTTDLRTGAPVRAIVEYDVRRPVPNATVNLLFYSSGDWTVASHFSTSGEKLKLTPGSGAIEFTSKELTLPPGAYAASCSIEDEKNEIDFVSKTYVAVARGSRVRGRFHSPHEWRRLDVAESRGVSRHSYTDPESLDS